VTPGRDEGPVLAHAPWLEASQAQDAEQSDAAMEDIFWDWLVVDHYALDERWEHRLRPRAARILCFDDLADRHHDCDALLDQNIQSAPGRYGGRVPAGCTLLLGTAFAQLRPEFARLRMANARQPRAPRLHVFMGGTDPKAGTVLALEALRQLPPLEADIVIGKNAPCLARVEELCRALPQVTLHVQLRDMAEVLARATMAIGAGGSASWERCCLGVPTLVMHFAQNQEEGCRLLAKARAAINLGDADRLTPAALAACVRQVEAHPPLLAQMSRRAASLVDGFGAQRVAEYMRLVA
jgi:UDP-2,4-diacetamido-2,4,6-trideoxy-beta-L-altropyranose hydrolase